jgi:hypothetical protein
MSEQSDATNAVLRERGILPPLPPGTPEHQEEAQPKELPPIRLPGRNRPLGDFARELGGVMCQNGVYLRSELAVVLDRYRGRLKKLEAKEFRSYVDDHAFLHVVEKSGEEFVKVRHSMKKEIAIDTLASHAFLDQQREIWRVNSAPLPVLRADGRLELLPMGYDYDSQILTMPSKFEYRVMPIDEARQFFVNMTKDFPMQDRDPATGLSPSLAVHMAAMLTPFCLAMLPRVALIPMFIYSSNKQGSGKSLLVKMILYCLFGRASAIPFGKDEEELGKKLDTEALANSPYIFFDNVKRQLASQYLDMWGTQATWKNRRMGGQTGFDVDKQGVIYISSNHAETDKDSTRRALRCELFIEEAEISNRKFDRLLDDSFLIREDVRQDMLSALWSLVVHWDQSGRPHGKRTLGSFEEWARLVCGIVAAAGFGDPLENRESANAGDTDTSDMKTLVSLMAHQLVEKMKIAEEERDDADPEAAAAAAQEKSNEFKFDEVITLCQNHDLFVKRIDGKLKDNVFELTRPSRIQMGKLFQKESGQIWNIEGVGRVRFGRKGSKNWRSFFVDIVV